MVYARVGVNGFLFFRKRHLIVWVMEHAISLFFVFGAALLVSF